MPSKQRIRISLLSSQSCFMFLFCVVTLLSQSAQAAVTETNIRSAILGRSTFTQAELTEMDSNADGQVDVADLVAFITADGTPAVWFSSAELTVSEIQGSLSIPIEVSTSFTGNLKLQLSGVADDSDYEMTSLIYPNPVVGGPILLPVTQGQAITIPLTVLPDAILEGTETLVITLLDEGEGGTYRTALPSVATILIKDGNQGACLGSLTYENGMQLPSQSIGFALEESGGLTAHFYLSNNSLLPSSFTVAASGDGVTSLSFTETVSGTFLANILEGREVSWQLSFNNTTLDDGLLSAEYVLSYDQGLTASPQPLTLQGIMRCNMID